MYLCSLVLSGLLLVLLSAEAKPAPQAPAHLAGEQFLGTFLSEGRGDITSVRGKVRLVRNASHEAGFPRRGKKKSRKKGKKKGCFRQKMDKIGAMSNLGC